MYRIIILNVLCLFILSCRESKVDNEIEVIYEIYNSFPNYLPPPPSPEYPSELESNYIKKLDKSKQLGMKHIHAVFDKFTSDIPFEYINDSIVSELKFDSLNKFNKSNNKQLINLKQFKNIIQIDKKLISVQDKKKHKITDVIYFSKPFFNISKDQVIIGVGYYASGLDSNYSIYFLKNNNNTWKIIAKKVVTYS